MARDPEQALDAARLAYERNDSYGSIKQLDRARRAASGRGDEELLRRLLSFTEGVDARDERTRIARDNLGYRIKQNLRQASRQRAHASAADWVDPYPELETPRGHTQIHYSLSLQLWIAVGVALAVLLALLFVAGLFDTTSTTSAKTLPLRIRNDTGSAVLLEWCDTSACDSEIDPIAKQTIESGVSFELHPPRDDFVDLLVFFRLGVRIGCLPVRVHDAALKLGSARGVASVLVSQLSRCPGTTVLPTILQEASAA